MTKSNPTDKPAEDITVKLTGVELRFLIQALRDVPLQGKPDLLAQLLPIVQGLRLKIASAAAVLGRAQEAAATQEKKPDAAPPPKAKDPVA